MRFFNTAGPIKPQLNYHIPPLERLNQEAIFELVEQERYFVLHAPRQTGKTSVLHTLRDKFNSSKQYCAVYVNVEEAQMARDDVSAAMKSILSFLARESINVLDDSFVHENWEHVLDSVGPLSALREVLASWCKFVRNPLILMLDEIDSLIGDTLISVLRQLRAGYPDRPTKFPQCVILCGVRDVRDYRIHSSNHGEIITGGSAFNIKVESLRLGDFSETQSHRLLLQHTEESGQQWSEGALQGIWTSTMGQPWLVNALARETLKIVKDLDEEISHEHVAEATEILIRRRDTHLDQLTDKLLEERVKRVIEPLVSNGDVKSEMKADDVKYVRDLGLIAPDPPIRVANPIYREAIPRELIKNTDEFISVEPAWYVREGRLIMVKLMESFQEFYRENSEHWVKRYDYQEAGAQLLLMAFLQRIVNSGGRIQREYGLGHMRTDLLITFGEGGNQQKEVVECKLRRNGLNRTIKEGVKQLTEYMERCGVDEGHLVIFDRSKTRSWKEKIFKSKKIVDSRIVKIWGM